MTKPIPCVGFELLYSPIDRSYKDNIAYLVHSISNKFIFDVETELTQGQKILILFSNKNSPTEHLNAEVKGCIKLDWEHFQVTLETKPNAGIFIDTAGLVSIPIIKGPSTARELFLSCPSCKNDTNFKFIANQDGNWGEGILPIYNCKSCGTTRAIIGLVKDSQDDEPN